MSKEIYKLNFDVSINVNVFVEADNEDRAKEIAENMIYAESWEELNINDEPKFNWIESGDDL